LESARVALAHHLPKPCMLGSRELGIALEQRRCRLARAIAEGLVADGIRNAKRRDAALPFTEEVAHPAQPEIGARDLEAILRLLEDAKSLGCIGAHVAKKDAVGRIGAASDAAPQLMELRETEALGMLDQHDRRVRHVDPDLD